ncbi:hypothetical protein Q5752_004874 [Cryptotrichosporon argae]
MSDSPITSVAPLAYPSPIYANPTLLSRLNLDVRGREFTVERETLMLLPESVLLGLFPQGLILSKPASSEGGDDGVFTVDFDPDCFTYILDFWRRAQTAFYGSPASPGLFHAQQALVLSPDLGDANTNPLLSKQAVIVLREELEFFSVAAPGGLARVDDRGRANDELRRLKREAGRALESKRGIFAALQRNVNKENNQAEQHLIDMLCMSGFDRSDTWGYRAIEPARNLIISMALVLLKTGIVHPGQPGAPADLAQPAVDERQMATAQKLLLFWRKPARKCWWDGAEVEIPVSAASDETMPVKVWARRVWTLELSLI